MRRRAFDTKHATDGLLAGLAGRVLSPFAGPFARPGAALVTGWMQNNATLTTVGALQSGEIVGGMLAGQMGLGGNGNGGGANLL